MATDDPDTPTDTPTITTEDLDLARLAELAELAARATTHPAWARRFREAAHVARLMAVEHHNTDAPPLGLDAIRVGLDEVKAAMAGHTPAVPSADEED